MKKTFIIAEAGVNHNGSLELAKKLIDIAVESGCDCIKFQTFIAENVLLKSTEKAPYQKQTTGTIETQFEMIKKLELSESMHIQLIDYCKKRNILFLSTPFDESSVELLARLGMQKFKIPSGEITNYPYLKRIGKLCKDIILSTGNSSIEEIEAAIDVIVQGGTSKEHIVLLHCTSEYPAPYEDVNLSAMQTLKNKFGLAIGYSDHTLGIEVSVAAVALGAVVLEKHFTVDKTLEGPDHRASLEPLELKRMVQAIRNTEIAIGDGIKKPMPSEIKNQLVARKSIVAKKNIEKGEKFSENNLTTKRPATGISPMRWEEVLTHCAAKDYKKDDFIEI
jgi:N,N'-diacetyllegionaminate synthase